MNKNAGQTIYLRLRPQCARDSFLPFEDIMGTMLHELTHNKHGPHDATFYAFLSTLEEEYYDLQRKGYIGDGFQSIGSTLGPPQGMSLSDHVKRSKALEEAEKRRRGGR